MNETRGMAEHGEPTRGAHQKDLAAWLDLTRAERQALRDGGIA
ncbi:MAG TPA: hypothetical protein VNM16_07045 [Bacillota bacterium]|nr:hypothetical protein [Bacillota bacterium]